MSRAFKLTRRLLLAVSMATLTASLAIPGALAQDKTSVVAALVAEPLSLNPIYDTGLPALNVFYNVFDQLTTIDATGKVIPRLATEWSHSEDLKTWTFVLRENATFHDGTPVTAADVLFTYETARGDPKARLGNYLVTVDTITANGDYEVVFTLKIPYAPFDRQATLIPIVSKAAYEAMGAEAYAKKPIASGPYSVENWVNGDTITLKRYDAYWGNPGAYETLVFQPVPDETTRANSVQSGDLDVALLGPSSVPAVRSSGAVNVVDQQSNRILYVGFNSGQTWLANPTIREAINLAIDRETLGARLLNGAVEPTSQLVAKVSFGFDPAITAPTFDVEKAKSLVSEAGYDGSPIPLTYATTGLPQIDQIAQAVAFFLQEIGLNVELDPLEASTYSATWFGGELKGIYIGAFAPSVMDADLPFNMLLRSGRQGYNDDPEVDALLDKQIGQADLAARAATLSEISMIVKDKVYYAPLFIDTYTYAVAKDVAWTPRPDGMIVFN